jgi:2-methylcitrate dehydratase
MQHYDLFIEDTANYFFSKQHWSQDVLQQAFYQFMQSLTCLFKGLASGECHNILNAIVPGIDVPLGTRVPGTHLILEPTQAAFENTLLIRWLHLNPSYQGLDLGYPSENIGSLIAIADYLSRKRAARAQRVIVLNEVLDVIIKCYEMHGHLLEQVSLSALGYDQTYFLKMTASAGIIRLMKHESSYLKAALSHTIVDGPMLAYTDHQQSGHNRSSWAGGIAAHQAMMLSYMVVQGEPGIPQALLAPNVGAQSVFFKNQSLVVRDWHDLIITKMAIDVSEVELEFRQVASQFLGKNAIDDFCHLGQHLKINGDINFSKLIDMLVPGQ